MRARKLDRLLSFVARYDGKLVAYPVGMYAGECLSLVKLYVEERFGIQPPPSGMGAAYGYWLNFPNPLETVLKRIAISIAVRPKPGDVVIWEPQGGNVYGHIAICVCSGANYFVSFDQNWGRGGRYAHLTIHNYDHVVGWLTAICDKESE